MPPVGPEAPLLGDYRAHLKSIEKPTDRQPLFSDLDPQKALQKLFLRGIAEAIERGLAARA